MMPRDVPTDIKLVTAGTRRLLIVAGVLVFLAGIQLFVFSGRTADYFAWTIDVPLTAAWLGAAYWSSAAVEWLAARERVWANARIATPTAFTFTVLTLVATLIHLDLFHLGGEFALPTQVVTWVWIGVYALVPPLMAIVSVRQARAPGTDPPRERPVPAFMRALLAGQAAVLLATGAYLFVAPERAASMWPWALTPLTGRAVGAWVSSLGVAAIHALWENDLRRLRLAAVAYLVLVALQGVALARFADAVLWGEPQTWLYLVFVLTMVAVGFFALAIPEAAAARSSRASQSTS